VVAFEVPVRLVLALVLLLSSLSPADQWWLKAYQFDQTAFDGSGVVVAVIDTGIDDTHPDLSGRFVKGRDFSGLGSPDGTAAVGPSSYHGTMVASLIAGQGKTSGGVIGVAPGVSLMSLSIGLGVAGADTDQQIADAVIWAVDNGAKVINLSLTRNSRTWPASWDDAFLYALENDVVVVAASGNRPDGTGSPSAPGTMPGVLSVGGLTKTKAGSERSSTEGIAIDITAPAEDLFGSFPGGEIRGWAGSSAAAPLVSGLVALMRQADPAASANDILQRLIASADDLGEPGFDGVFGFGAINPSQAISSKLTSEENPLGSLAQWVSLYRAQSADDAAELQTPEEPESQLAPQPGPQENANTDSDNPQPEQLNPLLYWVLAPLAPLLWLVWRRRRKAGHTAKSQEGKP
jgi:subtilisin family serine protease